MILYEDAECIDRNIYTLGKWHEAYVVSIVLEYELEVREWWWHNMTWNDKWWHYMTSCMSDNMIGRVNCYRKLTFWLSYCSHDSFRPLWIKVHISFWNNSMYGFKASILFDGPNSTIIIIANVKNRPRTNFFLTHHLNGLSLSFQKIMKLTLLDQRN